MTSTTQVLPESSTKYLVADTIFKEADTNKNGMLDGEELVKYLICKGETPSSVQVLLSKLDANKDGKVSLQEWRAGWEAGLLAKSQNVAPAAQGMLRDGDPGTLTHLTANMFAYSFAARMAATGFMNKPPGTDTDYRPTGMHMCCCNMCPCSMCCCTGKV